MKQSKTFQASTVTSHCLTAHFWADFSYVRKIQVITGIRVTSLPDTAAKQKAFHLQNPGFPVGLLQISFVYSHRQLLNLLLQFNELVVLEYVLFESQKKSIFSGFMNSLHFPFWKIQYKKHHFFHQILTYLSRGAEIKSSMSSLDFCRCLLLQTLSPTHFFPHLNFHVCKMRRRCLYQHSNFFFFLLYIKDSGWKVLSNSADSVIILAWFGEQELPKRPTCPGGKQEEEHWAVETKAASPALTPSPTLLSTIDIS